MAARKKTAGARGVGSAKSKSPKKVTPAKKTPARKAGAATKPDKKAPARSRPTKTAKAATSGAAAARKVPARGRSGGGAGRPGRALLEAAERAAKGALRVKPAEHVVLVTDKQKLPIAEAFAHWFHHVRAEFVTYFLVETVRPIDALPRMLKPLVEQADLTVYMLEDRAEEKPLRRDLVEAALRNGRVCMMPGVTVEMMERLVGLNYPELQDLGQKVIERMSGAREVRVTNDLGTDVRFSVFGRRWLNDTGDISQKGQHGNLPAGECFTSPVEETFQGIVHYSMVDGRLEQGLARFEKGRVVEVKGRRIRAILDRIGRDTSGKTIGEVGLGINRNARLCDQVLESEKSLGTVHFAIGDASGLGPNRSRHHHLMMVEKASVEADGEVILKDGEFQI